ncbi:MAG TPA: MaoC family dehydratase [Acetobacteraceae bacterium]|jgi:acyl dehydratase|nr:MaoC family dehydratase [Acetobacteraceae bacterium]
MLEIESVEALRAHIGQRLGSSDWVVVDQAMIDQFAEATGDHQWIHVDVERAKREMPGGRTIAHGYLTLSLLPRLNANIYSIKSRKRGVNYGSNKVRFTAPVPSGARVRGHLSLKAIEPVGKGCSRLVTEATVEVEGSERPALVAETLSLVYE